MLQARSAEGRIVKTFLAPHAVTLAAVVVAWGIRWLLDPWLGEHVPFITFFVPVVIGAGLGGLRPAVLATVLGLPISWYFLLPPHQSFAGKSPMHLAGLVTFFLVGLTIASFGEALHAAQRRSRRGEQVIRQREELLRITFASIGDAVITTDAGGRVTQL